MNEVTLVKRAMAGDETAFLQVLQIYENTMYRTAYAYLKNEHDAIEAVQEATYRCLKKIHTVKEPAYFGTWLVRILLNICHDMREKSMRLDLQEDIEIGDTALNHERFELTDIITRLPREQQELIFLKYFQDYKNQDIAALQNIPEGTVKSRLHAALKKLKLYFMKGEI
ncbi:sigma-70 family RNA polymerase sigma factor [Lysinibacillus agricola]|uniref:Sigma-70 family RNA polymerase sigma factor n=1 Tax=Lysinibacillus agricola TaxID=2590012 RepID=A0ABX7APT6_9BACI|nr:sigma-70 family RNA polymerase sigma factor [Lysinibacillus sp. FJAT-14222]QQP10938.1 sigma-70 family RNA polymerase sigma factor [Lysinibacillus agricola]